jgi:hypothetical protein
LPLLQRLKLNEDDIKALTTAATLIKQTLHSAVGASVASALKAKSSANKSSLEKEACSDVSRLMAALATATIDAACDTVTSSSTNNQGTADAVKDLGEMFGGTSHIRLVTTADRFLKGTGASAPLLAVTAGNVLEVFPTLTKGQDVRVVNLATGMDVHLPVQLLIETSVYIPTTLGVRLFSGGDSANLKAITGLAIAATRSLQQYNGAGQVIGAANIAATPVTAARIAAEAGEADEDDDETFDGKNGSDVDGDVRNSDAAATDAVADAAADADADLEEEEGDGQDEGVEEDVPLPPPVTSRLLKIVLTLPTTITGAVRRPFFMREGEPGIYFEEAAEVRGGNSALVFNLDRYLPEAVRPRRRVFNMLAGPAAEQAINSAAEKSHYPGVLGPNRALRLLKGDPTYSLTISQGHTYVLIATTFVITVNIFGRIQKKPMSARYLLCDVGNNASPVNGHVVYHVVEPSKNNDVNVMALLREASKSSSLAVSPRRVEDLNDGLVSSPVGDMRQVMLAPLAVLGQGKAFSNAAFTKFLALCRAIVLIPPLAPEGNDAGADDGASSSNGGSIDEDEVADVDYFTDRVRARPIVEEIDAFMNGYLWGDDFNLNPTMHGTAILVWNAISADHLERSQEEKVLLLIHILSILSLCSPHYVQGQRCIVHSVVNKLAEDLGGEAWEAVRGEGSEWLDTNPLAALEAARYKAGGIDGVGAGLPPLVSAQVGISPFDVDYVSISATIPQGSPIDDYESMLDASIIAGEPTVLGSWQMVTRHEKPTKTEHGKRNAVWVRLGGPHATLSTVGGVNLSLFVCFEGEPRDNDMVCSSALLASALSASFITNLYHNRMAGVLAMLAMAGRASGGGLLRFTETELIRLQVCHTTSPVQFPCLKTFLMVLGNELSRLGYVCTFAVEAFNMKNVYCETGPAVYDSSLSAQWQNFNESDKHILNIVHLMKDTMRAVADLVVHLSAEDVELPFISSSDEDAEPFLTVMIAIGVHLISSEGEVIVPVLTDEVKFEGTVIRQNNWLAGTPGSAVSVNVKYNGSDYGLLEVGIYSKSLQKCVGPTFANALGRGGVIKAGGVGAGAAVREFLSQFSHYAGSSSALPSVTRFEVFSTMLLSEFEEVLNDSVLKAFDNMQFAVSGSERILHGTIRAFSPHLLSSTVSNFSFSHAMQTKVDNLVTGFTYGSASTYSAMVAGRALFESSEFRNHVLVVLKVATPSVVTAACVEDEVDEGNLDAGDQRMVLITVLRSFLFGNANLLPEGAPPLSTVTLLDMWKALETGLQLPLLKIKSAADLTQRVTDSLVLSKRSIANAKNYVSAKAKGKRAAATSKYQKSKFNARKVHRSLLTLLEMKAKTRKVRNAHAAAAAALLAAQNNADDNGEDED